MRRGMAKRKRIANPILPGQLLQLGPTVPIDVRSVIEGWSDYKLSDGSVLSVKPMVADVQRVRGKYTDQGDPLYLVTGGLVIRTKSPRKLRKKIRP